MEDGQVTLAIAFAAGFVSFISPCVLPLVPAYLANLAGASLVAEAPPARIRLITFLHSLAFVLGFSLVFLAVWTSLGLLGYAAQGFLPYLRFFGGAMLIFMAFHVMGLWRIPLLDREVRAPFSLPGRSRYRRSFLLGILFAGGWTPCIGPILAGIIGLASLRETAWQGASLLLVYSLGLGIPFLAAALAVSPVTGFLKRMRRWQRAISLLGGVFILTVGLLMVTNTFAQMPKYFYWGAL